MDGVGKNRVGRACSRRNAACSRRKKKSGAGGTCRGGGHPLPLRACRFLKKLRGTCKSYESLHIVHRTQPYTLNDSNLRRSRPLRRSVSNLLRYSCRSVPQSTPGTPKTKSRACYRLRGPTIWRERSTVFTFGACARRLLDLICPGQGRTENLLREL